jgi:hypothetical protein
MMCESCGQEMVMETAYEGSRLVEIDPRKDLHLVVESPEEFDLYEWALEFSAAAGFEVERVRPKNTH